MTEVGARPIVLVVDDDEDVLELMRFLLEQHGCAVVTALNGRAALDAVSIRMPTLIVLDLKMPVMDGATFVVELRRRYDGVPPIIVVTAADDARKRARDVGAVTCLAKPFEVRDLLRTIDELLATKVRATEARS